MTCKKDRYDTMNPLCSNKPQDLHDNAMILDAYVNSGSFYVSDRFGVERLTLAGLQNKVDVKLEDLGDDMAAQIDAKIIAQGGVEIAQEWGNFENKVLSQEFLTQNVVACVTDLSSLTDSSWGENQLIYVKSLNLILKYSTSEVPYPYFVRSYLRHFEVVYSLFTYVSYRQFGAVLDGTYDDTYHVKHCHDYANMLDIDVKQTGTGIVNIIEAINVQTNTDISDLHFRMSNVKVEGGYFNITSKNDVFPVDEYQHGEFVKGGVFFPSLKKYNNHIIMISSDKTIVTRKDGGNSYAIKARDVIEIISENGLSSTPLIFDFTKGTNTLSAVKVDNVKLIFKSPTLLIESNVNSFIENNRSNVTIESLAMTWMSDFSWDDYGSNYLILSKNCINFTIKSSSSTNLHSGLEGFNYLVYMDSVIRPIFNNCKFNDGWHTTGTNIVKDWVVKDSYLNSIDVHFGAGNITCFDTKFFGQWGIMLGSGSGVVNIKDCEVFPNLTIGALRNTNALVYSDTGYGLPYDGVINIDNTTINNPQYGYSLYKYNSAETPGESEVDCHLPSVKINNVNVVGDVMRLMGVNYPNGLETLRIMCQQKGVNMYVPDVLSISNIIVKTGDLFCFENINPISNDANVKGFTNILIDNVINNAGKDIVRFIGEQRFKACISISNSVGQLSIIGKTDMEIHVNNSDVTYNLISSRVSNLTIDNSTVRMNSTSIDCIMLFMRNSNIIPLVNLSLTNKDYGVLWGNYVTDKNKMNANDIATLKDSGF